MFQKLKNMSSTLKILVDNQCIVYCDFEKVGEAFPNSIFKIELRKGAYIFEFKIESKTIVSKEYNIQEDGQDYLMKINLLEEIQKLRREQKSMEIANINACIKYEDGDHWIVNKDNGSMIRLLYNIEDHGYSNRKDFDMVGLRSINLGGEEVDDGPIYLIKGGKWGCINKCGEIQIPIIYDSSIYFYNNYVAKAKLNGKDILINKYGEQMYDNLYDSLKGDFFQNQIVCKNGKYGVIDSNGKYILPMVYDNLDRTYNGRINGNDIRFIIMLNNKYGIVDHTNNLLLPCIYDSIVDDEYVICVCCNSKWGVFDYNFKPIIPIEYEIVKKDRSLYDAKPVIVCKNGYYGILNINISKPDQITSWYGELKNISEIVPCVYNALYTDYGREIEPTKEDDYSINDVFFVKKDNEMLHCYKYELQKCEKENSKPTYTAICVKQFSCESFNIVLGEPYHRYLLYKNQSTYTLMDDNIQFSLQFRPSGIIKLPQGDKYLISTERKIFVYENDEMIDCIEDVEVCDFEGKVYGLKRGEKYAIYTPDFVQCTPFGYDSLSIDYDNNGDDGIVEFFKKIYGRCLYGEYSYETKSAISFGFLRRRDIRSRYNWAERYDFNSRKEGVISFDPPYIVVPFKFDYIRLYTGKKSTVFVVSKEFKNHPQRRLALMSTKFELLTDYIFKYDDDCACIGAKYPLQCMKLDLLHSNIFSEFNLSYRNIEIFAPFLNFYHFVVDKSEANGMVQSGHDEAVNPFKNIRLFVDVETTGLPINENLPYTTLDNWPFLVQVALIIEDDNYGTLAKRNIILKPDGYTIPESSTKFHGISNERAVKNGEDRDKIISFLDVVLYNSDIIIGHNVLFDLNVIKCEIIRSKGKENSLFTKKEHSVIDTMKIGMDICKIPNLLSHSCTSQPYKYPKLDELYYKLFNKHFDNRHDAMADIQATYDCYYELKRILK